MAIATKQTVVVAALAVLCVCTCVCLSGCSALGAGSNGHYTHSAGNLAGTWQFTLQSNEMSNAAASPMAGTIEQFGQSWTTTSMDYPGLPGCATQLAVAAGTEDGSGNVSFVFDEGAALPDLVQTMQAQGQVASGNGTMTGTWIAQADGECMNAGVSGTWSAVRVQAQ
jgi:hypothetical protein